MGKAICQNPIAVRLGEGFQLGMLIRAPSSVKHRRKKPSEDERMVAKSKPMRNLVSKSIDWSPTVLSSSTSHSPGYTASKEFKFGSHRVWRSLWPEIRMRTQHRVLK